MIEAKTLDELYDWFRPLVESEQREASLRRNPLRRTPRHEGHTSGNISRASLVYQRKYLPGAYCKLWLLDGPGPGRRIPP